MKSNISRNSFDPTKRYSGVYQQQGSLITDADWNEMQDVIRHNIEESINDIAGDGTPIRNSFKPYFDEAGGLYFTAGIIYAKGRRVDLRGLINANPFGYTLQPDYPSPPDYEKMISSNPYVSSNPRLYADIWDREIHPFEEEALSDKGLDGAITCTRTKRMAQIKVLPDGYASLLDRPGPGSSTGSATLSLTSRSSPASDYIFRLEVHDVSIRAGVVDSLVLKWSSENGSEVVSANDVFQDPTFCHEFFDLNQEKYMGVHAVSPESAWRPPRGEIIIPADPTGKTTAKGSYVRRWDGTCTLSRKEPTEAAEYLLTGWDRGTSIRTDIPEGMHGHAHFEINQNGSCSISLNLSELSIVLSFGKGQDARFRFLIGDYWLGTVRTSLGINATIIDAAHPSGIQHHYAYLGEIREDPNTKKRSVYQDEKTEQRQFPRLSELPEYMDKFYARKAAFPNGGYFLLCGTEAKDKIIIKSNGVDTPVPNIHNLFVPGDVLSVCWMCCEQDYDEKMKTNSSGNHSYYVGAYVGSADGGITVRASWSLSGGTKLHFENTTKNTLLSLKVTVLYQPSGG